MTRASPSRLVSRLAAIESARDPKAKAGAQALAAASDGLELAARVAEGAWAARPRRDDESDAFTLGYRVATAEMAFVLRCMRRGEPPAPADFAAVRDRVIAEASARDTEPAPGCPIEAADDDSPTSEPGDYLDPRDE